MRRRDFIAALGGTAIACPLMARGQQLTHPVIGFLNSASSSEWAHLVEAFKKGLKETGYVEGQNVTIEYRWAEGRYDRLAPLAADLVHRQVKVIAATGGVQSALAAKSATEALPIVFLSGTDPVKLDLVLSLNRPGRNATGVHVLASALMAKRLELLRELIPNARLIAALVNPGNSSAAYMSQELQAAAGEMRQEVFVLNANDERDFEAAFGALVKRGANALLIAPDPFLFSRRDRLVALAARHAVPAIYEWREFAEAGGLMSYGASVVDAYRLVGVYTGKILNGSNPSDLPVQQSTKVELVINLKTAKALGLTVSPTLLARADEVIE